MRSAARQAQEMLDAFASVGAERFDLTFTDLAGDKIGFYASRSLGQLQSVLPELLTRAAQSQHNVIVRPRAPGITLIQLDDLGQDAVDRLRPVSFRKRPVKSRPCVVG